jgi:hypothetical protein
MKERIADYNPGQQRPWWKRKLQGGLNRVSPWVRHAKWKLHLAFHPVRFDASKIPETGVPLIINNYNRLQVLQDQLDWLRTLEGISGILIVDNDSNYEPLLRFYDSLSSETRIQVVYLGHNSWRKGAAELAAQLLKAHTYVIVTDPDLLPYAQTPTDLVSHLVSVAQQYPTYNHVGTSLEINDIPDHNPLKANIFHHESKYWKQLLSNDPRAFVAPIDTTFAIYKQGSVIEQLEPALRLNRPYTLKHIDWYQNPEVRTEEYNHYMSTAKIFATWATEMKNRFGFKAQ